jgi:hypothetical protein
METTISVPWFLIFTAIMLLLMWLVGKIIEWRYERLQAQKRSHTPDVR